MTDENIVPFPEKNGKEEESKVQPIEVQYLYPGEKNYCPVTQPVEVHPIEIDKKMYRRLLFAPCVENCMWYEIDPETQKPYCSARKTKSGPDR